MTDSNENDVNIIYSPIKELVVHDVIKSEMKDLIRSRVTPQGNIPLYWCGGVLFGFNSLPPTKDVIKEYLGGRIHWMEVQYAEMAEYRKEVEAGDEQYLKTSVVNTNANAVHRSFVSWLKGNVKNGVVVTGAGHTSAGSGSDDRSNSTGKGILKRRK